MKFGLFALVLTSAIAIARPSAVLQSTIGWSNERMPAGMKRGDVKGEYLWTKTGTIMVYIPAGPSKRISIVNGADVTQEIPSMPAFYIDRYEVSVAAYTKFASETGYKSDFERSPLGNFPGMSWRNPLPGLLTQSDTHPAVALSWQDAKAYCDWAGLQLPSGDQWQKAALWDNTAKRLRAFPWGDRPLEEGPRVFGPGIPPPPPHTDENGNGPGGEYTYSGPVTCCSNDVSLFSVRNMGGNASEWCDERVWHGGNWFRGANFPPGIAGDQRELMMYPATVGFRAAIAAP